METPPSQRTYRLLSASNVALVSCVVVTLTTVAVWLFGLGQHRSLFANSLISTTILFAAFFLFITVGLYHGVKLRDDVGRLTDHIKRISWPNGLENLNVGNVEPLPADGVIGILVAIVMSVVVGLILLLLIWLVGTVLWAGILVFAAMLYWVFFRALRLVFKNSNRCRGLVAASLKQGLWYASLYTVWIYAIISAAHYLR